MDDESSPLKLKLYLFSSADADQQQDQRQLTVEDKNYGSLTGCPTYAYGLMIISNPCVRKIKTFEFSERLGKAKQSLERQYDK